MLTEIAAEPTEAAEEPATDYRFVFAVGAPQQPVVLGRWRFLVMALLALQVTRGETDKIFVCPVMEASAQKATWRPSTGAAPVLAMVDSGSAVTTCPVDHAPDFPIEATMALPMNAAGEGQTLEHHGRKTVKYVTRSGYHVVMKYEVTNVRFPILSVKRITKGGANAHFGNSGAWLDFPGYGLEQLLDRRWAREPVDDL